ncbi:MAG: hypothetical protein JWO15_3336 [Sphingomonadales bacterium]|nr:hypothetical protein [Sphingomonadales bacterium]
MQKTRRPVQHWPFRAAPRWRSIRSWSESERLPNASYRELVSLLMGGRLPIAVMMLTVLAVATLAQLDHRDFRALALGGGIIVMLSVRTLIVTRFKQAESAGEVPIEAIRLWELRYIRIMLPYAALLGLLNLHLIVTGAPEVRLLVVAETYGFCAGIVSRVFSRPQLCTLMVLIGALPTATGFFILGARAGGTLGLVYAVVGALFAIYAVSSLETVGHLYHAMLSQLATKRELAAFARVDALTGLANRLAMREKLTSEERRHGAPRLLALLLIDLDGFKGVNDRFGHPAGDRLLREVGRRLTEAVGDGDMAVRLGGDEFCIIQTGLTKPADAEALGNRVIKSLARPFEDKTGVLCIASSIGVALDDGSVVDIDQLIERADSALYRAKRRGGNTLRLWLSAPRLTLAA